MTRRHVIRSVAYDATVRAGLPVEASPLECSCGWVGTSGTFDAHRGPTADGERILRNKAAFAERRRAA